MTRERAIEVLKAWDLNWSDEFTANEFEQAFAMAISALSEIKEKWIPISERLPEKNEWVLVSIKQPSGNCYQEIMRIDKYRGLWTDNFDYYADYVKAWMPLPEPYKAESEDKE